MVAQSLAQPRLSLSAKPQVSASADIHEFSLVEGNVCVEAGVVIAPGTAVTAQNASVFIGSRCRLLPGVIVEAIAGPEVMVNQAGREAYSIYIGDGSVIAHKSLIHSPAFVGKGCFVGFRSTIFNARLGDGCVVMMHALVQDVEVPPGRCVPSGAVINSQHQADQLPKVRPEDLEFAKEVTGAAPISQVSSSSSQLRNGSSYGSASRSSPKTASKARFVSIRSQLQTSRAGRPSSSQSSLNQPSQDIQGITMQAQRLSPEIVQQVRQHLGQGYRIGMEHADKRRYRSGVWETCTPIKDTREQAVFEALERCLAEHEGEYVRMFGINPALKKRVGMTTVQRPGDKPAQNSAPSGSSSYGGQSRGGSQSYSSQPYGSSSGASQSSGGLSGGVAQEVRNLLNAGYTIGTEHAGPRHYRSNVWKVCSPIESRNEREVFSHLEHCLDEHSGEYVRMFGIDSQSKSRMATTTIQRADGKPVEVSAHAVAPASGSGQSSSSGYSQSGSYAQSSTSGGANSEVAQAVSQIILSGNKIGVEFADKRRYRSGIWQTAPSISASSESGATSQLQSFLSQHSDKYVRIFGINAEQKTRGSSATVQKPGQGISSQSDSSQSNSGSSNGGGRIDPINANPPHYDDPSFRGQPDGGSGGNGGGMTADVANQVTNLVNQGHRISIEFADKRRYRSGIWKTGPAISARRPAEALAALTQQLAEHRNDYVRLIGTDTNAKRRVAEMTIQRPSQKNGQSNYQSNSQSNSQSGSRMDPINANPPHYDDPSFRGQPERGGKTFTRAQSNSSGYGSGSNGGSSNGNGMDPNVLDQVTNLVNQGHRISLEYADKRRYRSGIWKTGEAISARRPAEAISELGKQLARHQGEYVRLIGVDTEAKRRVLETTIQRP